MVVEVDYYGEDPEGAGAEEACLVREAGGDGAEGSGEGHWVCWRRLRSCV